MASIKISELNEYTEVQDNDLFPVVDVANGETKKVKATNIGTGGKELIMVGDESVATKNTKLLIETDTLETLGTEVVNSLDGNETTKAPSVQAVNNALGHIVWTNSDTNIAFTPQNITLSNENYDNLLWIFKYSTGNNFSILAYSIKGMGTFANLGNGYNGDLISRQIDRVSNIEFTIHDGYLNKSIDNTVLIPTYVIALKRDYNFLVGGNNI